MYKRNLIICTINQSESDCGQMQAQNGSVHEINAVLYFENRLHFFFFLYDIYKSLANIQKKELNIK